MKRLLIKIFFWDEPAKGAFFGLTLFFTLPWLLLVWIFHNGRIPLAWLIWLVTGTLWDVSAVAIPIGVTLLCFLYALFLGWHGSGRHVHWHLKPQKADVFGYLAIIAASGAIFVLYWFWLRTLPAWLQMGLGTVLMVPYGLLAWKEIKSSKI